MEYFFVKKLPPIKSQNQTYRRRQIYKGFGLGFYIKDINDKILGMHQVLNSIDENKRIFFINPNNTNNKINVVKCGKTYTITHSNTLLFDFPKDYKDYNFIWEALNKNVDVRVN